MYSEHDDRAGGSDRGRGRGGRSRGRGGGAYSRARGNFKFPRGSYRGGGNKNFNPRSRVDDDDDVSMGDSGRGGYNRRGRTERQPYRPPGARRGGDSRDYHSRGRGRDNRNDRGGYSNYKGDPATQWWKIMIPHGQKVDQDFLLESIKDICDLPVDPVNFHYDDRGQAVFYVQGKPLADSLRAISRRITQPNGYKVIINTAPGSPPPVELDGEKIEKLKVGMSNRYKPERLTLDLSNFASDADLRKEGLYFPINRENVMSTVISIIEDHIPEVETLIMSNNGIMKLETLGKLVGKAPNLKSIDLSENQIRFENELDKIQGFQLEALNLDGNPVCKNFQERAPYLRAIRKRFPNIQRLDGSTLTPQIGFEVLESGNEIPVSQGSFFVDESAKEIVLRFLEQYFRIYDSGDRQPLLEAYHDQACFSLVAGMNKLVDRRHRQPDLREYIQESRNLKIISGQYKRWKSLRTGKMSVVSFLCELPKTQHDASSMTVDVTVSTPAMIIFMVTGLYKESSSKSDKPPVRFFSRTFVTEQVGNGLVITNEQLNITNPSQDVAKSFSNTPIPGSSVTPTPTPSPSTSTPTPSVVAPQVTPDVQKEMIKQFSLQSGMNEDFSLKCLIENDWNYEKSAVVFTELKAKGMIPPEAYRK
ncbi:nuclear RNA export factor 1-like [Lineus longissimus]|uniref:nuclear RNA export factor 1-like n=1 Tax=Lineus longissimus TaxID=88925 RepID=UPI002B4D1011